jgi:tetratricopeptide (TPR) repeat protein
MDRITIIIFALLLPIAAFSQKEKLPIKAGNDAYKEGKFDAAAENYEKALGIKGDSRQALFNYGNAMQRKARSMQEAAMQQQVDSLKQAGLMESVKYTKKAAEAYEKVAKASETKEEKNKANYNLGNARLMGGEVDPAITAYKESLRNNPADEDARYNLAYAQWLKKQQQDQKPEKGDEQKDEEQQQDQQKQDENNEQQQNEQQQKPNELSREEAEKMLDAMMNQEKDLMDKVNKDRHKAQRIKIEKDW